MTIDSSKKGKNIKGTIIVSIVIVIILIAFGVYIIIDALSKGEEKQGDVTVTITNNRNDNVIIRLEIDYNDKLSHELDPQETILRLFKLSEGTHTFKLFVDGSYHSSYDRVIESDKDERIEFSIY